jgi:glutathione S-transferase
MKLKLYSGPLSMFGAKAEIALHEKGIVFELVMVPFEMKTLYQPKHPEVARINPKRQVPVLIDGDLEIFDSTQIFEYLETIRPEPALWPAEPKARARARLLELKSDEVYFPPIVRLMGLQATPDDPAAIEARAAAAQFYDELERTMGGRQWLAGGAYSYADIAFYMAQLFGARMTAPMSDAHPRLQAWRERMSARPAVAKVAGAMGRYLLSQGRKLPDFLARLSA